MSLVQSIESKLIEALAASLPELSVEPFPEKPSEYNLIHPLGAILVQYDGGHIQEPDTLGSTIQERQLNFSVVSLTRNVRDSNGCYDVLERVRLCLLGLKLPGCRQIYQVSEQFVDETEGVWSYVQVFGVRTFQRQAAPNYDIQTPTFERF